MLRPDRVRSLRLEHGLTLFELAEKAGVSDRAISRYEARPIDAECSAVVGLAKALGVSADYLLGLTDAKQPENGLLAVEQSVVTAYRTGDALTFMTIFVQRWKSF